MNFFVLANTHLSSGQVTALFSGNGVAGIEVDTGSSFKQLINPGGTVINDAQECNSSGKWYVGETGAQCNIQCIIGDSEEQEKCARI